MTTSSSQNRWSSRGTSTFRKTCFWGIRSASSNKQGTKSFFSGRNALKGTLFCSQLCFTRFFFTYLISVFIILSILTIVYENLLRSLERTFYGTAAVLFVIIIIVIITVFITFILILLVLLLLLLSILTMMQFKKFKLVQKRCMHALFLLFSNNCVHPGYEYFFTVDF